MKITEFRKIPKATEVGSWQCDFGFDYLMTFIDSLIEDFDLQINPDFQRGRVWTDEQSVKWLEAHFSYRAKNSNVIYLNIPEYGLKGEVGEYKDAVVVDGLQRYTAIKRFMNDELKVFGSYYSEFTDTPRMMYNMSVNINSLKTKDAVLQWYIEMNEGGTPHTQEEIDRVKQILSKEKEIN